MVSAWSAENGLVLGQVRTNEKSNEITAIPMLLSLLDIEDQCQQLKRFLHIFKA
jgi:hypothetical protein